MRFLLDQGLPRSTAQYLAERGLPGEHVGDLGLATAADSDILAAAAHKGFILVTLDADFHGLLARRACTAPSVIRIRIEGLKGADAAALIADVAAKAATEIEQGAAISVTERHIRVHLLPLV